MVKLTPELIECSRQFINAVKDRELDLRGYKIPAVENLGATYDQFDTIDFSDNDIRKLDGFPYLPRLKCLLLNNNRIAIADNLGENLPHLNTIILTSNNLQELGDLDALASFSNLEYLCLLGNPVVKKPQYRLYVIYRIPQVRVLDYIRIKQAERLSARAAFKGKKGKELQAKIVKHTGTVISGETLEKERVKVPGNLASLDDIRKIKEAIVNAKSMEEVERLNQLLQSGQIPGKEKAQLNGHRNSGGGFIEEEEEMEAE